MRASGILFVLSLVSTPDVGEEWKKHVVHEGDNVSTAIAADFNRDGRPDIISNSGGKTRLFLNPDWTEVIIDENAENDFIHSEVYDVDGDGDPDFIGARYSPGRVVWLECPEQPQQRWRARVIDETVNGIHGLLKGDVDGDGRFDLIANSAQPVGEIPDSAVWFKSTSGANKELDWKRYVFADRDAPGLSHYFGFGDVDGDGRPDISLAAKGGPTDKSGKGEWFAWWQAGDDPTKPFKKHKLPGVHPGATNIQQADVNGDGRTDFIASLGHGDGLLWFENPSWRHHVINDQLQFPHCLQVADIDADGDLDAATCAYGSRIAAWFENDGRGNFKTHIVATNQAAYDLRLVDIDLDGDLDMLIAGQQSKNVVWFEHPDR